MTDQPITVFYDGGCGVCSREIAHYRRLSPKETYDWVDITQTPEPLHALGISTDEGLRIMHVQNAEGALQKGVDAFLCLWSHMPYWRHLRHVVGFPGIYHFACFAYTHFARWRYKRLGYCKPE